MTVVATEPLQDEHSSKEVESASDVEYTVTLNEEQSVVEIIAENPTKEKVNLTGYVLKVDKQRVHEENLNLSSGEQRTKQINITDGINVNQDEHTVTFSTFGGHAEFNFTRKIDSADSGKIPTPYIADVEVTEGTIAGEPSSVANVTLVNPSEQLYSTKLMVHTVGTDGSLYPASVRPGDTRTITVELLDDRGAEIAGEARLYTGNTTTAEGGIDQVEFAGQSGDQTQVWNDSYEPVRPTWMQNNYEYRNDSYGGIGTRLSSGHELAGIPIVYICAAVLIGLFAFRRFR
ncbi:hypothetical protein [Halorussus pelagicus]|uniref:hypothetical protein n=1 Tax=Halorussus pelagicus TaxID=2505977 RepID=UPI001FB5C2B1|nr:hypothetical protein [Halorussus pelagicus]